MPVQSVVVKPSFVKTGDWPTLGLWIACYCVWGIAVALVTQLSPGLAALILVPVLVLQSSLSHEILHGHPFSKAWANTSMGLLAVGIFVPYLRFRDTHLLHHIDERLTDPYDDPESNFLDPEIWVTLAPWTRKVLQFNNTLLGRMVVGPLIGQIAFYRDDIRRIARGEAAVMLAWALHVPVLAATVALVAWSGMPVWLYLLVAYAAMSVLKIRTFLEHRAAEDPIARTVIVEQPCILSFLFLNNSLHVVHHMHPKMAWHSLPRLYRSNKDSYLACNQGYVYTSYSDIFRRYLIKSKDPVPHPRWPMD